MKYQLCPKCNGQGVMSKPPWIPADLVVDFELRAQCRLACDVCHGVKVLLVPDEPTDNYSNQSILYSLTVE